MSVPDARERARAVLARGPVGSAAGHALARDVLALADENERLRATLETPQDGKALLDLRDVAVAEAATLRQALAQIAESHAYELNANISEWSAEYLTPYEWAREHARAALVSAAGKAT